MDFEGGDAEAMLQQMHPGHNPQQHHYQHQQQQRPQYRQQRQQQYRQQQQHVEDDDDDDGEEEGGESADMEQLFERGDAESLLQNAPPVADVSQLFVAGGATPVPPVTNANAFVPTTAVPHIPEDSLADSSDSDRYVSVRARENEQGEKRGKAVCLYAYVLHASCACIVT